MVMDIDEAEANNDCADEDQQQPQLRTETDTVSETLCFLVFRISYDGQSPETQ
jgi:hypothetical protein